MSRSVDLFIAAPESLDAVAAKIGELANANVGVGPGGRWVVRDGETSATLCDHQYVDDGELLLSRYQYVLSGRTDSTSRPQDTPVAELLRRIASVLQCGTSWGVLLVLDLQYREKLAAGGSGGAPASGNPREAVDGTER